MKIYTFFAILCLINLRTTAQDKAGFPKDIDKIKIEYVQQGLDLTELQKKSFVPLYSQWQTKEHILRKSRVQRFLRFRTKEEIEAMSNVEVNKAIDEELNFRIKIMQLERYYLNKIRAVIPPKKVVEMFKLQESFKRELLRKYHNTKNSE